MSIRSQAELEYQYHKRTAQVQSGTISPDQAFGNMEEWVVQLGQRKALLHPGSKQWMWYGKLHDEWVFAGCGVGEAILLSIGSAAGLKKLPQPGDAAGWCVTRRGQELIGPVRSVELLDKLKSQPELKDIFVWSTLAANWLSVIREGNNISFIDEAGNEVKIIATGEEAPVAAPVIIPLPTDATVVGSRPISGDVFALSIHLENQRFPLGAQLRLGSDADNDLTLPDKNASLHHALIQRQGVVYKITDLNSSSGTFVNGNRITGATLLKNGDIVLIGDTRLKISDQH